MRRRRVFRHLRLQSNHTGDQRDRYHSHRISHTRVPSQKRRVKLETFAVTGIRVGIEAAVANKKESSSIVESISAEDIGKLPDISIAESIARLPGVAAQQVGRPGAG